MRPFANRDSKGIASDSFEIIAVLLGAMRDQQSRLGFTANSKIHQEHYTKKENMNLDKIIISQLKMLGLEQFVNLAREIKTEIEPAAEAKIRPLVASGFKRVCLRARKRIKKQTQPKIVQQELPL